MVRLIRKLPSPGRETHKPEAPWPESAGPPEPCVTVPDAGELLALSACAPAPCCSRYGPRRSRAEGGHRRHGSRRTTQATYQKIVAPYANDEVLMPLHAPAAKGPAAIRWGRSVNDCWRHRPPYGGGSTGGNPRARG
jgi:hypothetical protein